MRAALAHVNGLSTAEATERLSRTGPNALPERRPEPLWRRFVRQFDSPLIFILLFALAFDLGLWLYEGAHGWPIEASAIGLILFFNAALGLYQEQRSEAALARLKALAGAQAWVLRDGELVRLPTQALVPGDSVRLEAGDRIPADGTLQDARGAMLDESILTGESVPVDKGYGDEAFSGTLLVRGKTFLEVTRTDALSASAAASYRTRIVNRGATKRQRTREKVFACSQWRRAPVTRRTACHCLALSCSGIRRAPRCLALYARRWRRASGSS